MATVNQSVFKSLFIILAPFSHQACDLKLWVSVVCCDVARRCHVVCYYRLVQVSVPVSTLTYYI